MVDKTEKWWNAVKDLDKDCSKLVENCVNVLQAHNISEKHVACEVVKMMQETNKKIQDKWLSVFPKEEFFENNLGELTILTARIIDNARMFIRALLTADLDKKEYDSTSKSIEDLVRQMVGKQTIFNKLAKKNKGKNSSRGQIVDRMKEKGIPWSDSLFPGVKKTHTLNVNNKRVNITINIELASVARFLSINQSLLTEMGFDFSSSEKMVKKYCVLLIELFENVFGGLIENNDWLIVNSVTELFINTVYDNSASCAWHVNSRGLNQGKFIINLAKLDPRVIGGPKISRDKEKMSVFSNLILHEIIHHFDQYTIDYNVGTDLVEAKKIFGEKPSPKQVMLIKNLMWLCTESLTIIGEHRLLSEKKYRNVLQPRKAFMQYEQRMKLIKDIVSEVKQDISLDIRADKRVQRLTYSNYFADLLWAFAAIKKIPVDYFNFRDNKWYRLKEEEYIRIAGYPENSKLVLFIENDSTIKDIISTIRLCDWRKFHELIDEGWKKLGFSPENTAESLLANFR